MREEHGDGDSRSRRARSASSPVRVRIFFDDKAARFMQHRQWHPMQKITHVECGIEPMMEVSGTVEVVSWMLVGDQAEVELQRVSARYQRSAG